MCLVGKQQQNGLMITFFLKKKKEIELIFIYELE